MSAGAIVMLLLLAGSVLAAVLAGKRIRTEQKPGSAGTEAEPGRADSSVCPRCGHEMTETGRKKYDRCAMFVIYQCPACGEKKVKHVEVKLQYSARVIPAEYPVRAVHVDYEDRPVARQSGYVRSGYIDEEESEETLVTGTRIEHPHYIDDTDYECSVCGSRFDRASDTCPHCGAVFVHTEVDNEEYYEEEDEEDAWDEEDGL